jgi:regulatory subunit for Cdc7p protein kinase
VPLGSLPNAANSPFREPVPPGTKRPRTEAAGYEKSQHPAKKQAIEVVDDAVENRARQVVGRKVQTSTTATHGAGAAGVRKIAVAKGAGMASAKNHQVASENLNEIRQWQRHYKKMFPQMVFYYDNVPDDTRHKIGRQIQQLGSVS